VQALPSMQLTGAAGRQTPFWQKSPVVQEFPSLQGPVMTVWKQPVDATHPSVVHGFPSSQLVVDPGVHVPLTQRSPVVQALPSLQESDGTWTQSPVAVSQLSWEQSLRSLHDRRAPGWQVPFEQKSAIVQGLPS
jgi:hypothetical protein